MDDFGDRLGSTDFVVDSILRWEHLLLLVIAMIIFPVSKFLYTVPLYISRWRTSYESLKEFNIDEQLVKTDNKGLAVSFAGYLVGVGLVIRGSLSTSRVGVWDQLLDEIVFTAVGLFLLFISQLINDKVIFYGINNGQAIMEGNVAVGILEAATSLGSGIIIGSSITASNTGYGEDLGTTGMWFVFGQLGLVVFCKLYELITKYDDKAEIMKGNAAAGIGYGFTIVAVSLVIASPISKSDSLLGFALSYVIGSLLIIVMRVAVDKLVLRGRNLDDEITEDSNWGAAIVEGFYVVAFAAVFWSFFRVDDFATVCTPVLNETE